VDFNAYDPQRKAWFEPLQCAKVLCGEPLLAFY
jgi:hypothetical protein